MTPGQAISFDLRAAVWAEAAVLVTCARIGASAPGCGPTHAGPIRADPVEITAPGGGGPWCARWLGDGLPPRWPEAAPLPITRFAERAKSWAGGDTLTQQVPAITDNQGRSAVQQNRHVAAGMAPQQSQRHNVPTWGGVVLDGTERRGEGPCAAALGPVPCIPVSATPTRRSGWAPSLPARPWLRLRARPSRGSSCPSSPGGSRHWVSCPSPSMDLTSPGPGEPGPGHRLKPSRGGRRAPKTWPRSRYS